MDHLSPKSPEALDETFRRTRGAGRQTLPMNLKEAVIYDDRDHWERPDEESRDLWPTPRTACASMWPESDEANANCGGESLATRVAKEDEEGRRMWPTPAASEAGDNDGYLARLQGKDGSPVAPNERIYDPETGQHVQVTLNRAVKLFPTPMAAGNRTSEKAKTGRPTSGPSRGGPSKGLEDVIEEMEGDAQNWPTPRSRDWKGADHARDENRSGKRHGGDDLATAVDKQKRWPTPTVFDSDGRPPRPPMDPARARAERGGSCHNLREWVHGRPDEVEDDAPAEDTGQDGKAPGDRLMLNPDWVDWLMGWPVGWTNPDPLPDGAFDAWARVSVAGSWWHREPSGIPRITSTKTNRTNRLKADGNGQVSLCAAAACVALFDVFRQADEVFRLASENRVPIDAVEEYLDGRGAPSARSRKRPQREIVPLMADRASGKMPSAEPADALDMEDFLAWEDG